MWGEVYTRQHEFSALMPDHNQHLSFADIFRLDDFLLSSFVEKGFNSAFVSSAAIAHVNMATVCFRYLACTFSQRFTQENCIPFSSFKFLQELILSSLQSDLAFFGFASNVVKPFVFSSAAFPVALGAVVMIVVVVVFF